MSAGDDGRPAVSVVIPAYCGPDLLNQALESVRSQTFTDYEIIVVDDCSGGDCVSQYQLDEKTRLIRHPERRGPAGARNTGIAQSRGRYIALLDMDDIWLPDKLEKQVDALEHNPNAGLAFCHYRLVDDNLQPLGNQPAPRPIGQSAFRRLLGGNIVKSCSVVMLRREAIQKCGVFDEGLSGTDDWDLWLRIAHDYEVLADPTPLVLYRVHAGQLSRDAVAMRLAEVQVVEKWLAWAQEHDRAIEAMVRGQLCVRLQRLARAESRTLGLDQAVKTLKRAMRTNPWDWRCYVWRVAGFYVAAKHALLRTK